MSGLLRRFAYVATFVLAAGPAAADPARWAAEWPDTDFSRHSVPFDEIISGGPPKDGIPSIDRPQFVPVAEAAGIAEREPVIRFAVGDDVRAYPLAVLIWHEIVNDTVGGVPVAVTYCPLCNSAVVFDRRLDGRVLEFGTTGKLRHSDLVMYDRQTQSWWQQFVGEAIVGAMTGQRLTMLPARIEPFGRFRETAPNGKLLVPGDPRLRSYGVNPYAGYDSAAWPFLLRAGYEDALPPLAYVVAVGDEAWPLSLLQERGRVEAGDLVIAWEPGMASALDTAAIADGRDLGVVTVQRGGADVVYDMSFAFAFRAFHAAGVIHLE
ncbi:MAG: DUF3179 domain-containing protein [Dongiaceae bacterium]